MPSFHRIEDLPSLAGQTVITRGWVMTTRSSGKIGFVMLRDGTGYLQVVLSKKDVLEPAPGGDRTGAPRGRPGDPRLLLRAALHPRGYADPQRGDRRARRDAVRHRVFRPRESLPRPNGTAVRRSRGGGARQGLLLRTD